MFGVTPFPYSFALKVCSGFAKLPAKRKFGAFSGVRNLFFVDADIAIGSFAVVIDLLKVLQCLLNKALLRSYRFVSMLKRAAAKHCCYLLPGCMPEKPRIAHVALCRRILPAPPLFCA